MSEQNKDEIAKDTGIEVDRVVFDSNGLVVGLDDEILGGIAGGLMDTQSNCVVINSSKC